nr:cysteine-tryptophan domain-containing zinc finger protein 3-like isoform X2 [Erigeron canadensis]
MNGKVKQEVHVSSGKGGDKFASNGQQPVNINFANTSDPKSLKVRIKVGSDNLSTRKKAEIYSGLGLDVSPSSSLEASPLDSNDICHVPRDTPRDESPTSILEMMTSFPVLGGLLLSPLPYNLLFLTENEKREDSSCGSVHKQSHESTSKVDKFNYKAGKFLSEKKPKIENNYAPMEPVTGKNVTKKEADNNWSGEALVSNASKLPISDTQGNALDFRKGAFKSEPSVVPKEESPDPVNHDDFRIEKPYKKERVVGNSTSDEKVVNLPTKSESDVSKSGKIVDNGLAKPPKQKAAQGVTSHEKDASTLMMSSSGSKKKSNGRQSLENGFQGVEDLKMNMKNESASKNKNHPYKSKVEDPKHNNGKARETYKDFFGELDPELEDGDDLPLEDKPLMDKPKNQRVTEKGTLESNVLSKDRLNGKKGPKPSSIVHPVAGPVGIGVPVPDGTSATVTAVVNDDWVCCDKCEKWRLLPRGVNPGSLPEKWLCSMLDWLPGMNRCSISQEETTKAMATHFLGPAPAVHGFQPVQPGASQSELMMIDPLHLDQRHQPFGQPVGMKKKHGMKDLPNEPKPERPSLSSNSTKRNLQTSNKTRSLNGANQSPLVMEPEFQDSGQSSSLITEKHKFKHKEKKKLRENFVDEGNNALHLKIKNRREGSQDNSRDSKKVKTDDNCRTDKDWTSDHGGAVFKAINSSNADLPFKKDHRKYDDRPKDTKSTSRDLGINHKNQNELCEERDAARKRKSTEFDDSQVEETSETGQKKGKKAKIPESWEEEKGRLLDNPRRDVPVHTSLAATSSSSKVSGSHRTKTNNHEAKGSPVESVSSSPLRILNPDKFTSSRRNIEGVNNSQNHGSPKKDWEDDRGNYRSTKNGLDVVESLEKVETVPFAEFEPLGAQTLVKGHTAERRKSGKGSSSRSKEKHRSSKSDIERVNLKKSERTNENSNVPPYEEKSKGGRNRSQDKLPVNFDKIENGSALNKESSVKPHSIQDLKQNLPIERDGERSSKKDVSGRVKPHSLPPSGKVQNETSRPPQPFVGSHKENGDKTLSVDGVEGSDASKAIKQKKKAENQNGNQSLSTRHPTPNRNRGTPSPLRRESSSQAASAIKEAKALKHMADRLKNNGSNHESNSLYFQAALKFLYGSSVLESNYTESGKHSDMIQSTGMYSSTAKLCEYVAHEYEKSKEMAAAALAYKLAEVAYLKVVYSSHTSASKDRQELQTTLTGPTGESPSSSASDIDNLNNPAVVDKVALLKGVNDPQLGGNHVIAARSKPNFLRILNFAQDVNFAMEASRRSQIAFAASGSQPEHANHKEVIKPALDFNFQDIEGLLQIVRVAMEVISK